jgi:hypothetical protein
MRAILQTDDRNYLKYNGITYKVSEMTDTYIQLEIPKSEEIMLKINFHYSQVMIVDFSKEIQKAYDDETHFTAVALFNRLQNYAYIKRIFYDIEIQTKLISV